MASLNDLLDSYTGGQDASEQEFFKKVASHPSEVWKIPPDRVARWRADPEIVRANNAVTKNQVCFRLACEGRHPYQEHIATGKPIKGWWEGIDGRSAPHETC